MDPFTFGRLVAEKIASNGFMDGATNMANNAIQHPIGQKALGAVAAGYNSLMPQSARGFIGNQMGVHVGPEDQKAMAGTPNLKPEPFQRLGQQYGSYVNSNTEVRNDELTKDQIDTWEPAKVTGTPLQQLQYGLSNNRMPSQTYTPGSMTNVHTQIKNDNITQQGLAPLHPEVKNMLPRQ
jgi:hypothetical protein